MKNLKPLLLLSLLSLFIACKKDKKITPEPQEKPDPLELATDSGSYTVNGKTYTVGELSNMRVLNADPHLKIDSIVNHSFYISGNKDSVFFSRSYTMFNAKEWAGLEVSFFKKYSKKDMNKNSLGFYVPNNLSDLIHVGKYDFQVDYTRVNAHDGVAIDLNGNGKTFSKLSLAEPTQIKQESENGTHFEIITFKSLKSGGFLLEAKFDAVVFDANEMPQKLTNGYIRMKIP